jgi:hypothetical protein
MFLMLAKTAMYILHVFPPPLSVLTHTALVALYSVSIAYQAGSDMSDPKRPQPGAPWYISKSCSVAQDKDLVGYCRQAKAAFACSVVILYAMQLSFPAQIHQLTSRLFSVVFASQLVLAVFSLFPSPSYRAAREAKRLARESRYAALDSPVETKVPAMSLNEIANAQPSANNASSASGALNPMTPRTMAFNRLGGTKDLPLRNHFSSSKSKGKQGLKSPTLSSRFALRSPTFPGSPLSPGFENAERKADEEMATGPTTGVAGPSRSSTMGGGAASSAGAGSDPGMYFPPPPKVAVKGVK